MAQADYNIDSHPSGVALRTEINTIFQAVLSNNSGATAPTTTVALMFWVDTSNGTTYYLKQRNHTNDAWVSIFAYDVATKKLQALSNGNYLAEITASTGAVFLPSGTTAQRPTLTTNDKALRFNTTLVALEYWNGTAWDSVSGLDINALTAKTTPVDADNLVISDSASSHILKKLTWANLKTILFGSPALTGTPTSPTATAQNNSTQIATTAYVDGKFVRGTAVNSTSGTSIDFTGIPSWVKRITIMFNGVSTNGASALLIQLGSTTIETTGYLGTSALLTTGGVASNYTTGFGLNNPNAAHIRQGQATLVNFGSNVWSYTSMIGLSSSAEVSLGGGSKTLAGVLDRVRITTVNGTDTFDSGSINIIYEG